MTYRAMVTSIHHVFGRARRRPRRDVIVAHRVTYADESTGKHHEFLTHAPNGALWSAMLGRTVPLETLRSAMEHTHIRPPKPDPRFVNLWASLESHSRGDP